MDVENMLKFYFGVNYADIKNCFIWAKKKIKYYVIEVVKRMNMKSIFKKHPNKLVILSPLSRNQENKHVISWQVLQTAVTLPDVEKMMKYYTKEGYKEVCCFSTFNKEEFEQVPELPPDMVAQYYRVLLGTEQ